MSNIPWPQDPEGDMAPILELSLDLIDAVRAESRERHPSSQPPSTLTAHDRCDRCGAQALFRVAHEEKAIESLLFCGHDFRANAKALTADGWIVVDGTPVEIAG